MKKFTFGVVLGTVLGPAAVLALLGWKAGRSPDGTYAVSLGDAPDIKMHVDLAN